ncbi:MAG: LCP family protein [Patescibacteria group bacterium]|nr:LCP family protein [Patescibacteria group bacterium]
MKHIDSASQSGRGPKIAISGSAQPQQANLLGSSGRKPKKILKIILSAIAVLILILAAIVISRATDLSNKIFIGQKTTFLGKLKDVLRGNSGSIKLSGEDLGQINILLLGIGGEGHDGPYLTDTMILAQIRPDIGQIALTSIPRDYLTELPEGLGSQKINAAFALGFSRHKDFAEAGQWAEQAVENLSGLKISYFAVADFAGFEKAIDKVGGIDVNVEHAFTDYEYPNDATGGYLPPLAFQAGWQHMDGKTALEFARSRHAAGIEGSDFARSVRQQKIIQAFKDKALNLNMVSNAGTLNDLLGIFADHFHTNMSPGEILRVYNLVKEKNISHITSLSLDPDTKLICPEIQQDNGAYVLVPCAGKTGADVQNFFKNAFAMGSLYEEKSVVWMANSTGNAAIYQAADKKLKSTNLTVWEAPYGGKPLSQTIVYQVNPKPATVEYIKNTLNATEVTLPPPGLRIDKSRVDVVVILGDNGNSAAR